MTADLHLLLQNYYTEPDPERRQAYLVALNAARASAAADDPAANYRNDLFEARHIDRKKRGHYVDRFLWNLMTLIAFYKNPGLFPRRRKKQVLAILRSMELDERPARDSGCEQALYLEYRHAIHRYFLTCAEGPYASRLLGLAPADKQEKERQRCYDTWAFSYGIASLVGLEKELALLCRAANDEYCASVPGTASLQQAFSGYRE